MFSLTHTHPRAHAPTHQRTPTCAGGCSFFDPPSRLGSIVFELADGGDLFDLLKQGGDEVSEQMCRTYLTGISAALVYIHSRNVGRALLLCR